jgi:hypothetical protein
VSFEATLVVGCLVAVDDAARGQLIQIRLRFREQRSGFVATLGILQFFDHGPHPRPVKTVLLSSLYVLADSLFGRLVLWHFANLSN